MLGGVGRRTVLLAVLFVVMQVMIAVVYMGGNENKATSNIQTCGVSVDGITRENEGLRDEIEILHKHETRRHFIDDNEWKAFQEWQIHLRNVLQRNESLPSPYFFVHMAKTGGTTMMNLLKASTSYPVVSHFWYPPTEEVAKQTVRSLDLNQVNVIGGHMCWGTHRWWNEPPLKDYTYFTVLREPIDRVVSHYRYHLQPEDPNHWRVVNRTFVDWVKEVRYAHNVMTAYMAGIEHNAWWNSDYFYLLPNTAEDPDYIITEVHYKRARMNLITSVIGLQEEFDKTLDPTNSHLLNKSEV